MRILLSGLLLIIAVPVLGLPYTWDRLLYIVGIGLIGYGIFILFFNGKDHYEEKIDKKTEKKEKKKEEREIKKEERRESKKNRESTKAGIKKKRSETIETSETEHMSVLTDEDKAEISRSVRES